MDIRKWFKWSEKADAASVEYEVLKNELYSVKDDLDAAYQNFSEASKKENLDYYIYQIKTAETRYHLLLKQIRSIEKNQVEIVHLMPKSVSNAPV